MADKSKTIKNASDKELNDLILRLRKENELQDLVCTIKRKSLNGDTTYDYPQISTEEPIETLYHYGIFGMHWGHKKGNTEVIRLHTSEDHDKKMSLKGKKLSEMSNDELRTYTQRSMLEKQYKDLSKADISLGHKLVNKVIDSMAKGAQDATLNYVNKKTSKMVEDLLKKATTSAT